MRKDIKIIKNTIMIVSVKTQALKIVNQQQILGIDKQKKKTENA